MGLDDLSSHKFSGGVDPGLEKNQGPPASTENDPSKSGSGFIWTAMWIFSGGTILFLYSLPASLSSQRHRTDVVEISAIHQGTGESRNDHH